MTFADYLNQHPTEVAAVILVFFFAMLSRR